jgi:hypothetical protein
MHAIAPALARRLRARGCSVGARTSGYWHGPFGTGVDLGAIHDIGKRRLNPVPAGTRSDWMGRGWTGLDNLSIHRWIGLRIRRLGVRVPSGARDHKGSDLPVRRSVLLLVSSLVVGWVLGGCSCDERPSRPARSGRRWSRTAGFRSWRGGQPSGSGFRDGASAAPAWLPFTHLDTGRLRWLPSASNGYRALPTCGGESGLS